MWHRDDVSPFERIDLPLPDGRSLEVFVGGGADGVPVVYHNGSPSSGRPYQPFVDLAEARGLRMVTYARPGYSRSSRNQGRSVASVVGDIRAVLDHLGAASCYTMGWSGGGPHALACAALVPDRVIAAASVAGVAPYPSEGLDWMGEMGDENKMEFGAALQGPGELQAFLEEAGAWVGNATADGVAAGFGDLVSEVDVNAITGEFAEWLALDLRESVSHGIWGWFDDDMAFLRPWGFDPADITRPTAIWQGDQDRMVPFAHGEWLAQHVGSATAHLLSGEGHLSLAVTSMGKILDELLATRT